MPSRVVDSDSGNRGNPSRVPSGEVQRPGLLVLSGALVLFWMGVLLYLALNP